uniref:receptor-like protein EIX2 n=1 Tax=Erigeron canadensis TaxID=72917 RepID=UPI001CB8FE25|nr:receptor-like protein EIX2 [Erigeron canadensis]
MKTTFFLITFLFFQRFGLTKASTSSNITCIETERQSLLAFQQGLGLSTWSGVECCKWSGVRCDPRNGHIVKLDLHEQWLKGELTPSLKNIKHLRHLDLSMNDFSGNSIPDFLGSFQQLTYLNLSRSNFGGVVPHQLVNLSMLQYLDLSYNELNVDDLGWVSSLSSLRYLDLSHITIGKHIDWFHSVNMLPSLLALNLAESDVNIPSVKYVNFTSLNSLDLSFNDINATIPGWLSNLTSLVRLDLSYNMFFGLIPTSLGRLLWIEDLNLGNNQLSGNIPMSLWQLSKLKSLDLSYNSLVGVLSETHFTNLKNLNYLMLSGNSLALNFSYGWITPFQLRVFFASSCYIGPHFPHWLQTQINLQKLDLSNSSIRDTIPEWFENNLYHIHFLDLSNNQISGKLPRLDFNSSNHTEDRYLKLNSNRFEGPLAIFPSNVKLLDLSDNQLSGHIPQTNGITNPNLEVINLSKNFFKGSIPIHLCKVTNMFALDLSQNKFSGRLPRCLGNLTRLQALDLSNNTISGVVPGSLGSLEGLISMHLQNNRLEGDFPISLRNLGLATLDLGNNLFTGTIPSWIGEKVPYNLEFLNIQANKFTGDIPLQLCQHNNLQYLSLARNNITGTIPDCFGNFTRMMTTSSTPYPMPVGYEENIMASIKGRELQYNSEVHFLTSIDLSNNNIVGEIPKALMSLIGLINLNLSGNHLQGQIPPLIGDLKQLESLDLSMNKLSGRIPQSLTSLHFLSYLNLSFNNLSGPIPIGNQLQTLDDISNYQGNDGLCGPPVSKSCNGNNVTANNVGDDEGQGNTESLWFYAGMGPGFVAGLVGLLGSLHFIRRWRLAYFETLEKVCGLITASFLRNLARRGRKFSNEVQP